MRMSWMLPALLLVAACSPASQPSATALLPDGTKFILSSGKVALTAKDGGFTISDGNISVVVTEREIIANGKTTPRPAPGSVVRVDASGNVSVQ